MSLFYIDIYKVLIRFVYRFLWVEFQLDSICAQVSDNAIEKALESIPENMNATYERILDMINKKPRAQRELARKVLMCVAYTRSPLPISILAIGVSIENDTESLEALESSIPTKTTILSACSNLVSVDSHTQLVRFVHFSVQEFLTSDRLQSTFHIGHDLAHRELARMFITIISVLSRQSYATLIHGVPIWSLIDILNNWPFHVLAANLNLLSEDDPLVGQISSFLGCSPPMFISYTEFEFQKWPIYLCFSSSVLALMFNLPIGHQHCRPCRETFNTDQLRDLYFNLDPEDEDSGTSISLDSDYADPHTSIIFHDRFAMHYATSVLDSVSAAERLYAHGHCVDYFYNRDRVCMWAGWDYYSDCYLDDIKTPELYDWPLIFSAKSENVARFLLDCGVSLEPHDCGHDIMDPLEFFAHDRTAKILQLLLGKVVDQDGVRCGDALSIAVHRPDCSIEVIKQLLDKGADLEVCGSGGSNPLQGAAGCGKFKVVQLLLDRGADVHAEGGLYGYALSAASLAGCEMVQLLLDHGADINAQGGHYGNALQVAALLRGCDVVQLLLDQGADINAQGGEFGNALQAAAHNNRSSLEVVQLLLDNGADVHAQGGKYGSALQAAALGGGCEVIKLILDKGANVNAEGGMFGNALQGAIFSREWEVVQLLLERGAHANAQSGTNVSPLQAAAHRGSCEIIQLLLDHGADIHAQGGILGNALQAAACWGDCEVVQLLLDKGADVNAQGGKFGSALQGAVLSSKWDVGKHLVDKGANVNAQGGSYGSSVQGAALWSELEVVKLLLENGADVNARGGEYGTVLEAAVAQKPVKGNLIKVVKILLDYGADITVEALTAATKLWEKKPEKYGELRSLFERDKAHTYELDTEMEESWTLEAVDSHDNHTTGYEWVLGKDIRAPLVYVPPSWVHEPDGASSLVRGGSQQEQE